MVERTVSATIEPIPDIVIINRQTGSSRAISRAIRSRRTGDDTIDVIDPSAGEVRAVKLFAAAMGASNYSYAEAVGSESLED